MKFQHLHHVIYRNIHQNEMLGWYLASLLILSLGTILAARHYPGGFDWFYTVASALASQKNNPAGSIWFASALVLSMVLLWPYVSALKKCLGPSSSTAAGFAIGALRFGMVFGAILGLERLLIHDLSHSLYKGHEVLGLFAFLGLYFGVLGLLVQAMLRRRIYIITVVLILAPLLAIGVSHFWLYLDQRELGWVDRSWREMGIPIWLSFAFWQWLAIGFLSLGLGLASLCCGMNENTGVVEDD